ncbi:T9SS type A sorting domain-containing protein [Winogradskyella sp. KYW1333]|uniref:T9SS type A sorting domain-containing protein n=1 Tax=Winogradskyella sp. KYW1333 TaxID=2282123 RepID=UPI000DF3516A|nr:T9SS type A sorting domain-containing protein [Winogradskyella sp. KYW1333]RCT53861.1 T9SS C-terminal target domain-containing protein [Winogradskyella sp. KYW1333]
MKKLYFLLFSLMLSNLSYGQTVASTSFEEPAAGAQYVDTGDASIAHDLINNVGESDVDYVPGVGASEIGFDASYIPYDTPSVGLTDGDFVGVSSFTGTVGSYTDGNQGYQFSDIDGIMVLEFDSVDMTAYTDISVNIDYFVGSTGWESADFIKIYVRDLTNGTEIIILDTNGSDIDDLSIEGAWITGSSSGLSDNINLQLVVEFSSNSGSESLFLDNVLFVSGSVPTSPTITVGSDVSNLGYEVGNGVSSVEGSFTVEGSDLIDDITVDPPANYEISTTTGGPYVTAPIVLQENAGAVSSIIFTRLISGLPVGNYIEDVDVTSTDATPRTVSLNGSVTNPPTNAMRISGVFDAQDGSSPKGIELEVLSDIPDLSIFGIGGANNGGGTDGQEFTFPSVSALTGDLIYIVNSGQSVDFNTFFGVNLSPYETTAASINGDDAIELFESGQVIDVFGIIDCDPNAGSSPCPEWEYTDGWAYRNTGTGPDGSTFVLANWSFSGVGQLDGTLNNNSTSPYPSGNLLSVNQAFNIDFSIYPNPTNTGNVTITSTNNDVMDIQVFDVLGKQVINQRITNNNLNVSSLKSGLYIVKINQNNTSVTKKLVIK